MSPTLDILAPPDQIEGTRFEILLWLKSVGDSVSKYEPLVEIETDKATTEVAAPAAGVLLQIIKGAGDRVCPGDVLGRLDIVSNAQEIDLPFIKSSNATAVVANADSPSSDESGARSDRKGMGASSGVAMAGGIPSGSRPESMPPSPAVRRLVRERNLDIGAIIGTGDGGRITVDDVLSHESQSNSSDITEERGNVGDSLGVTRSVPHTAIRKRTAARLVESLHTAPHATGVSEADLSNVFAHQSNHVHEFAQRGVPLTQTAYFMAATITALRVVPEANSRWTDSALEIYEHINIGIATNLRGSLVVPVLRNVESLDFFGIAKGVYELVSAAQHGNLCRRDILDGTFTISSHDFIFAAPIIINPPQSAILGIGAPEKRATVVERDGNDALAVRFKCYAMLTFDHRVMDGYRASRFLEAFVSALRDWPTS